MCENVYEVSTISSLKHWPVLDLDERGLVKKGKDTQTSCAIFFHLLIFKSTARSCRVSSASPVLANYCAVDGTIWRIVRKGWEPLWAEGLLMLPLCVQQVWLILGGPEPVSPLGLSGLRRREQASCRPGQSFPGADIHHTLWLKVTGIHCLTPRGQNSKPKCLQGYIPMRALGRNPLLTFQLLMASLCFRPDYYYFLQLKKKKKSTT